MSEQVALALAKPILRTWASESHLESLALLQENAMEWMFDNYVNLMGSRNYQTKLCSLELIPRHDPADNDITLCSWMKCPFIEFYSVSHHFVRNAYENILEYIMHTIEEGYCVYLKVFQEILSTRTETLFHSPFIYGFDKEKKILYVADHYNRGKYDFAELGFDEFQNAYEFTYWDSQGWNLLNSEQSGIKEKEWIYIAKARPFQYEFNIDWFKLQLKDYLDSSYSLNSAASVTEGEGYKRYFGISNYDLVIDYIDLIIMKEEEKKDRRIFTLLCDHKKLLLMRMEFFQKKGICSIGDEEMLKYRMLNKNSELVLGLFLKYLLSNKEGILKKMQEILRNMKTVEWELLSDLQKRLQ